MAEKSEAAEVMRLRFELLLLDALEQAEKATDHKQNYAIESRLRMLNSGIRCCSSLRDLIDKEDKMTSDDKSGEQTGAARTDELRAEIERRLARIRASFEHKEAAEEAYAPAD